MAHDRPKAVAIVGAFLFAATGIAFVVGLTLLFPNPAMDFMWKVNPAAYPAFRAMGRVAGVPLIALGVGTLAAGVDLLRRKKWAWWFAMILFAINGCGDVVGLVVMRDVLRSGSGVLIASAFLWALGRGRVRRYFSV